MNKYAAALLLSGMFLLLIPGAILYLIGYEDLGRLLMFIYLIPLLFIAIVMLIILAVELIREWKEL